MKILILYEELAGYFVSCVKELSRNNEIYIICEQPNNSAPFDFSNTSLNISFKNEYTYGSLLQKVKEIEPDAIFVGGWKTPMFNQICKMYSKKINVVLGFDNAWKFSIKQFLNIVRFRLYKKNSYTKCFVPGQKQKKYAKLLGFKEINISMGAYSCDYELFNNYYESTFSEKEKNFPKRLLFVGRYSKVKGIEKLWNSFIEVVEQTNSNWELWCIGKGEIPALNHPKIKHLGFIQPDQLDEVIRETGVFVLPSNFEPWGVVIHEYALAGFPIISSTEVGANEDFVLPDQNGWIVNPNNSDELKKVILKVFSKNTEELIEMGKISHELGGKNTPQKWAKSLMNLMQS
ncbi:glycosyltransferase family 4 protein [Paracrocinitomix mangrovi]|uniref:glycosyltransferase family 4 protein n=1 Tax=Paracrocinitomix mangrovi TaxID=2862509 RepID=UPI001C8ED184|nr:glycosyltransferase family 4 protein [Paracrocinitomix mangrovi]UKN02816.1 glycosyltransferase family 4 protein [Paracrocinitomix mangrovi]